MTERQRHSGERVVMATMCGRCGGDVMSGGVGCGPCGELWCGVW